MSATAPIRTGTSPVLSASSRGWGSGWPNCPSSTTLTTVEVAGIRLPCRTEIAPLVAGLVLELGEARRQLFRADWCWGFACRAISGTDIPSNHSWGLAVDLDAPENPYMSTSAHAEPHPLRKSYGGKLLRSTMPLNAAEIASKWGFYWGGLYTTKPDPMHFEFALSRDEAALLIAELRDLDGRPDSKEKLMLTKDQADQLAAVHMLAAGSFERVRDLVEDDYKELRKVVRQEVRGIVNPKDLTERIIRKLGKIDGNITEAAIKAASEAAIKDVLGGLDD